MNSSTSSDDSLLGRYIQLIEISRDIASTLDLDVLLNRIVHAAADVTKSSAASILLYDESKQELYFHSSTNIDAPLMRGLVVPIEGSIAGDILKNRKPIIVMSTKDDPRHFEKIGEETEYRTESLLGVPLISNENVTGVLEVINRKIGEFSEEDQELLVTLAAQAAIAIENSRLFQQSDLIAEMVHELRTPLASINTASHLLTRPEISAEQSRTMAETIQKETSRLSEMASSFLDLARLESGRNQFKVEPVDLKVILDEVLEIMGSRIQEQGLTPEKEFKDPIPEFNGDAGKLKQVIINLVSNAIKYNRPNGKIMIKASATKEDIIFSVEDTGNGMLPEHVSSLFQKFYRVPGSEKMAQGTGLGLSIVKKIVEGHGGKIEVESESGKGTKFTVNLPLT